MTVTTNPYRAAALDQVWRLAALVDRNPHSRTRGSFSRTHWAWKFSDFPFPRLQEGVCALVRLRELDDPHNPLFGATAVDEWVRWGFEYWVSLQHANGAFDEAYPNEQCLAATAFTSFYLGDAFLRCRDRLDPALRARLESTFSRAGSWLCRNDETHGILSNHLAAAAAALETIRRIAGRPEFSDRARVFIERILEHQSTEGWLREYDGADIGYGTHGFFYLAAYWKMTGCERTHGALDRFAGFLEYFVHPDGTIGGEYGSRDTEFYYPAGFELFAAESQAAAAIAAGLRSAVSERRVCGVWSMDAYNFMPMLNNVLFAVDAVETGVASEAGRAGTAGTAGEAAAPPLPYRRPPFAKRFDEAGLWVVNRDRFYAVVGLSKGGTVSVFDKAARQLGARHSGLVAARQDGDPITSQDYRLSPVARWTSDSTSVELVVPWKTLKTTVFAPFLFLLFRLFTMTLGRFPAISRWVKTLLVHTLIRSKSRPAVTHLRRIAIAADGIDGIEIVDDLTLPSGTSEVRAVEQFTAMHMGSAFYADVRSAGPSAGVHAWPVPASGRLRLHGRLTATGAAWSHEPSAPTGQPSSLSAQPSAFSPGTT